MWNFFPEALGVISFATVTTTRTGMHMPGPDAGDSLASESIRASDSMEVPWDNPSPNSALGQPQAKLALPILMPAKAYGLKLSCRFGSAKMI